MKVYGRRWTARRRQLPFLVRVFIILHLLCARKLYSICAASIKLHDLAAPPPRFRYFGSLLLISTTLSAIPRFNFSQTKKIYS